MIALAALTGPLPKLGVVAVALLAAAVLLIPDRRAQAAAMAGALVLAPVLLGAEIWHSPQLGVVHRHPLIAAVGVVVLLGVVVAVAIAIVRRPSLLAILTVIALPFRIPVAAGGSTANLLVPLYFVVAAGALAQIMIVLGHGRWGSEPTEPAPEPGRGVWVQRLLAVVVVLYAVQATYSPAFETALKNMVFFYVPFALLLALLTRLRWSRRLIGACIQVLAAMAVVFVVIAFYEYATKTIILNSKLVAQNDLHTYFVVNSVFFDPDIFGRFLALVMIVLAALLLFARSRRDHIAVSATLAVLWGGLVLTLSRSSIVAVLVGLATLVAVRFRLWRTVALVTAAVICVGALVVAVSPRTFGLEQGLNGVSAGRGSLLTGGVRLFGDRPVQGFGAGSFQTAYHRHNPKSGALRASHTIAVTIAAEQGLIGLLPYLALIVVAIVVLARGAGRDPPRLAIAAAFVALVVHTQLYADFLEDPLTWTLLGVGIALARAPALERMRQPTVADAAVSEGAPPTKA